MPDVQRAALAQLRELIRAAAPQATERISYQMPIFYHGGPLVGFAAFKNHCSLFVMGTEVMNAYRDELAPYRGAKATLHFTPDQPLPEALVTRLVKARIAENESRRRSR